MVASGKRMHTVTPMMTSRLSAMFLFKSTVSSDTIMSAMMTRYEHMAPKHARTSEMSVTTTPVLPNAARAISEQRAPR